MTTPDDYQTRAERAFVEGDLDPFDFALAESLHMTVEQMRDEISNSEYLQWRAYHVWKAAQHELAAKDVMRARRG